MTNIEAMKLALDALDGFEIYDDFACLWQQKNDSDIDKAIAALRQAISEAEQAEQEPKRKSAIMNKKEIAEYSEKIVKVYEDVMNNEPVAWLAEDDTFWLDGGSGRETDIPLYTAPPQREWVSLTDEEIDRLWKIVSTPPQSEWMSLMDDDDIEALVLDYDWTSAFARAIEAKLKEKNNPTL